MSAELTAFYRKCLDEVEATARGTGNGGARWQPSTQYNDEEQVAGYSVVAAGSQDPIVAALGLDADTGLGVVTHAALHDPQRALWEVEAGRKLLSEYERWQKEALSSEDPGAALFALGWLRAIAVSAAVFRDRPGYKHEWSP